MATNENVQKALQAVPDSKSLKDLIESSVKELGRALPDHLKPERLVRIALTCIRQTPDLAKCTPESFLGALFTSAQLGIEPIAGRAYLLPFNNARKKSDGTWHTVKECQFILGYRGVIDLFFRHSSSVSLQWGIVREKDKFEFVRGTDAFLNHKEAEGPRGEIRGFWVMANLDKGGKPFHYMTMAECLEHAKKHSKTFNTKTGTFWPNSPWLKDFEAMALKTVLIQLCKILPLSVELQRAIGSDETARDIRPGVSPAEILDLPDQVNWDAIETEVEEKNKKPLDTDQEKN
jgi:recombination protein RecT